MPAGFSSTNDWKWFPPTSTVVNDKTWKRSASACLIRPSERNAKNRGTGWPASALLVGASRGPHAEQPARHQHLLDRPQDPGKIGSRHVEQAVQGVGGVERARSDPEAQEVGDACVQTLRPAQFDHGRRQISAQDSQSLPLEVQRVVPRAGAYLQQTRRVPFPEQIKEALPLIDFERLLPPAVAFGGRSWPILLTQAGNDPVVLLHGQDRILAAARTPAAAS
jgi:hypothetical protein